MEGKLLNSLFRSPILDSSNGRGPSPGQPTPEQDQTRRAVVVQMAAMLIGLGLIALLIALRVGKMSAPSVLVSVLGITACIGCVLLARSRLPVAIAGWCLIGSWFAALFSVAYLRGGLGAPLLIAIPIIPMIAATVISRGAAWLALAAICFMLLVLTGLELSGHRFPQQGAATDHYDLMRATWVAIASLMCTRLATYYVAKNERLTRQLHALASTDALTGIANRRAIAETLDAEVARAKRNDTPLAVLMLDVDHFKEVNDQRGHQAGDDALARIAKTAAEELRSGGDAIGRWGGEEFLIVMPHGTPEGAEQAADRIRQRVANLGIRYRADAEATVTVTIGIASRPGSALPTAQQLIDLADRALYEGKHQGRDRVEVAAH